MALTEAYTNTATISTTEYSLPANSTVLSTLTDVGVFQTYIDLNALTATEHYVLRIYEKVGAAGTKRLMQSVDLAGVQSAPVYVTPAFGLMSGWDVTLQLVQGTARAIAWSIRKAA